MLYVTDTSTLHEALQFIAQSETLSYDIETTGLNVRTDFIIGFGISNGLDAAYFPISSYLPALDCLIPAGLDTSHIKSVLKILQEKKLLMFNAAFDAVFTKNFYDIDLVPALHADVLLLKHTCDEEFPFGLKEIAAKLWGHDVKKEKEEMLLSIKTNGGRASEYFKADTNILAKYCMQDCLLTYRLYNHYSKALKAEKLEKFFYEDEVMPLYKEVTIPMEQHGVSLDLEKLVSTKADLEKDIVSLQADIHAAIGPLLESVFVPWLLNKDYPTQTRTGKLPIWARKGLTQREAWEKDHPGERMFNLQSKHHLKKLFFDTLGETPISTTPTGMPQVDDEFLQSIATKYAWVQTLLVYNKLTKLQGTYYIRFVEEQENGKLYPRFMQHRTVSGRYSGDLQQLPRPLEDGFAHELIIKYTNIIRELIIAPEGQVLIGTDYEQLEPSIFAHTSGDKALQAIFLEGKDFYSDVAIRTERLVDVSSDKKAENYLGKINKSARQKAKAYALGIAYGMTGYKLQFELEVSLDTAERLVSDYLAAFPDLASWMERSRDALRYDGKVTSISGRVRHLRRGKDIFDKYGARVGDSLQLWKDYHNYPLLYAEAKDAHKEYKNLCNNAINFQVQSLAASIVNRAAIAIMRRLKMEQLEATIIMQVHDELVLQTSQKHAEKVAEIVRSIMENIMKLAVPLKATPQFGNNYRQTK